MSDDNNIGNEDITLDGGTLNEVVVTGKKRTLENKDITLDGGTLNEVVVTPKSNSYIDNLADIIKGDTKNAQIFETSIVKVLEDEINQANTSPEKLTVRSLIHSNFLNSFNTQYAVHNSGESQQTPLQNRQTNNTNSDQLFVWIKGNNNKSY